MDKEAGTLPCPCEQEPGTLPCSCEQQAMLVLLSDLLLHKKAGAVSRPRLDASRYESTNKVC